jgi:hypothetical protein
VLFPLEFSTENDPKSSTLLRTSGRLNVTPMILGFVSVDLPAPVLPVADGLFNYIRTRGGLGFVVVQAAHSRFVLGMRSFITVRRIGGIRRV